MKVGDLIRFKQGSREVAVVIETGIYPRAWNEAGDIERDIKMRWMDGRIRKDCSIRFEVISEG